MRLFVSLLATSLVACAAAPAGSHGDDDSSTDAGPGGGGGDTDGGTGSGSGSGSGSGGQGTGGNGGNPGGNTGPCDGAKVPGDYANLQTALDALANAGTDATICLGEGDFTSENNSIHSHNPPRFYVRDSSAHRRVLKIIGMGRGKTKLRSTVENGGGWATVMLQGVAIQSSETDGYYAYPSYGAARVELLDVSIAGRTFISSAYQSPADILIDRCDFPATSKLQIATSSSTATAVVSNSYVLGALEANGSSSYKLDLKLVNNTFVGPGAKLSSFVMGTIANSIFTDADVAAMSWDSTCTMTTRNNAVYGNTANYALYATEGSNYVKTDCLLDASSGIPALAAGSPCIDHADMTIAPDHDFMNNSRGTHADIGAVERQ